MNDALSVISLDQAKNHLVILNDTFYDGQVTGIIKTAVALVEKYTGYYFYERPSSYPITGIETDITDFPVTITGVTDQNNNAVSSFNIRISKGSLRTYVNYFNWSTACFNNNFQPTINATIGYANVSDIPQPLIGAAYKLITYLFENKDLYGETIPSDIQMMLNQFRRGSSGL